MNGIAALMAWFVLRPMRRAQMEESVTQSESVEVPAVQAVRSPA
jgi:hypothetical protein